MKTRFEEELAKRILILDGAMGTMLQKANLTVADFGGEEYEGCNEILTLTRPGVIRSVHEAYLEAGADLIETNTFGSTTVVLAEYNLAERDQELNRAAAKLARETADRYSTPDKPRFVAGSMGPTTKSLSLTGGVTFEELEEAYYRQAMALIEGGVDVLLVETAQDTLNVKAAGAGIQRAFAAKRLELPVMVSGTIEPMGTTLAGQNIEAFYVSIAHLHPVSVGLNCATGPEFMRDHIRSLAQIADCGVSCYPNAGLPDEEGHYHEEPEGLARKMVGFAEKGWLNIAGGCCGTTPEHVQALAKALQGYAPRLIEEHHLSAVSGLEPVYAEDENRPLIVGERTNVIGSKKFRDLIAEGHFEEASEIARAQVKKNAQVIDVCLANPDRDEYADMAEFLPYVVNKVKAPLMIDSTDSKVIELGLKHSQGKAIINSINLEDGLARFKEVVPLLKTYGAAVVIGTIDEQGMAVTREKKLEVAKRSFEILTEQGVQAEDIIFDPLTFPVATGDVTYIGSARETVEGIRLIKQEFPQCKTILGVSNVSFGLPAAGREVLNAVFLYHTTKAGLDYAIVNSEKLVRYASLLEEERKLADALLFETNEETVSRFAEFYRNKTVKPRVTGQKNLSIEERLGQYVVEGSKEGLFSDLEEGLHKYNALELVNGPLMKGMEEVGCLFNANQLIVAEVLQSAEVMKAAVTYLEPYLEKKDAALKGKILLATVKGDVHDIGKNLLEIILSNNGFEVINLGIKVSPEQIIAACEKEKPDAIGLSGLLVKSAEQMAVTAQDLKNAGIRIPLLTGGAALTARFVENKIVPEYDGPVLYAGDAMKGLALANQYVRANSSVQKVESQEGSGVSGKSGERAEDLASTDCVENKILYHRSSILPISPVIPADLERHVLRDYPLAQLWPYINRKMLLGKHLGIKGDVEQRLAEGDPQVIEVYETVEKVFKEAKETGKVRAQGIYRFFPAQSLGDEILIYDAKDQGKIIERFHFPRQVKEPYLCLADFLRPVSSGEMDYLGMFAVTAGQGVREVAAELMEQGAYLESYIFQALALELAEGFAERLHHIMRDSWGISDPVEMTMKERLGARYRGLRVSFGYPACPDLEDQKKLLGLIKPGDIGIELTEGLMMEPEASVSALVFAHPEAKYFSVL
ncbi:methionine synthase [Desulfitobacterium sp.]|uniref:methionine synthase n=1 Tax=Desulfitobacterium sp. TaxID=49981 RepID=UPI002B5EDBB7|nr:methionine synthase [Desulfitobacterium sp.]HVJ47604.1 methionine synthase [Desulfitobacterium sp.]